ncbi:MAG: putative manganese-dependent inorganic diphosphatase [Lachnospiraceae bacterium]|jgi:manganese-dependent inorganic pyrophosphatase|nr:putative manganese-dependent inorganic diphosphatase [Lachnospiraceae bacterium]
MQRPVYILGHKNPDTDSICSAIAYAELKQQLGFQNVKPFRLGNVNHETEFVLNYFGVEVPELVTDISPSLRDLDLYTPESIEKDAPLKAAWAVLSSQKGSRILPVMGEDNKLEGIISIGDITNLFMKVADEDLGSNYEVLFKNLIKTLDFLKIEGTYPYEKIEGAMYIGSTIEDISTLTEKDVVITNDLDTAKKISKKSQCGCLILTNSQPIDDLKPGKHAVASVKSSLFKTIGLLNQSISVGSLMKKDNILTFSADSFIDDVIDVVQSSSYRNFPVVDRNGDLVGIISRRHLIEYNKKKVILVDHNERSQSIFGIEQAEIIEIIDHHRVADVQTDSPVFIRAEPLGSTATIIYKMFIEAKAAINRKIAGLLLSAILSDTLKFLSPTSTEDDKMAAHKLATIAEVDIDKYSREMFAVSTSLQGYTPEQILAIDRKQFTFGKYVAYIAQVNTLDFRSIVNIEQELVTSMEKLVDENYCDLFILMITDIAEGGTELLTAGRGRELLFKAFGMKHDENAIFLPGVVSRKKQIVPKLTIAAQ